MEETLEKILDKLNSIEKLLKELFIPKKKKKRII